MSVVIHANYFGKVISKESYHNNNNLIVFIKQINTTQTDILLCTVPHNINSMSYFLTWVSGEFFRALFYSSSLRGRAEKLTPDTIP